MIGKVVFRYKSNIVEAVMEDDGSWRCDAIPCLVRPLNALHSPGSAEAPLDRKRCLRWLKSAALWLHGEVWAGRPDSQGNCLDRPVYAEDYLAVQIIPGPGPDPGLDATEIEVAAPKTAKSDGSVRDAPCARPPGPPSAGS